MSVHRQCLQLAVWRFSTADSGVQCVMTASRPQKLTLFVISLDSQDIRDTELWAVLESGKEGSGLTWPTLCSYSVYVPLIEMLVPD